MFFTIYNKLTAEQIAEKLGPAPAPGCAAPAPLLAGREIRLTLEDGPVLSYRFDSADTLTLQEDGGAPLTGPYCALALGETVLVSHLLPGTVRGYQLALDLEAGLATVFKTWFCGYADQREVQRQIYFGRIDGDGAARKLHARTNRLEGRGFHWTDDRGVQQLTFFPSVLYSSFVELGAGADGQTICAPSDYVKLTDRYFVYSRVECEYSGTLVLELLDLFRLRKVGVRLGFDEQDALDYRMYTAEGRITGYAASFEPMTDYGETVELDPGVAAQLSGEGARPVYRPRLLHPDMSQQQVDDAIAKRCAVFSGESIMAGANDLETSAYLVGRRFTLRFDGDGPVWQYEVDATDTLRWRAEGETGWHTELYRAFEPAEDVILFSHIHTGSRPSRCVTFAADFSQGLVTCVDAHIGNGRTTWEVGNCVHFGVIEGAGVTPPSGKRHAFTTELVGKSFAWSYSDIMSSIHVYSSPNSYSWTIFLPNNAGGMMWSSPCFYVKLREDAFLFCWVEETCNGNQGLMVFNPRIMHDGGFFFGVSEHGLSLTTLGAVARFAGSYDILGYFER